MFRLSEDLEFRYVPILSVKISEMDALAQLADKSKDIILPLIPIRPWQGSKDLSRTFKRIHDSFGERKVIVDIDHPFLDNYYDKKGNEDIKEVVQQIKDLTDPQNGYHNWVEFVSKTHNFIPTLQLTDTTQLESQMAKFIECNRGIVVRFNGAEIDWAEHVEILERIAAFNYGDLFIIYDYGQVFREVLNYIGGIANLIQRTDSILNGPLIAISSTSFPSSFSGHSDTDFSIIERLLFNKLRGEVGNARLIYSDWGSARADRIEGGGRVPPPRLDYPLKNEWMILRDDFENFKEIKDGEKAALYRGLASKMIKKNYWDVNLKVWGTQLIELTSLGDEFGITTPQRATAVRINIHLHQQLYYDNPEEQEDMDELWVDE